MLPQRVRIRTWARQAFAITQPAFCTPRSGLLESVTWAWGPRLPPETGEKKATGSSGLSSTSWGVKESDTPRDLL